MKTQIQTQTQVQSIESMPSATPVDASNTIPSIINSPTVSVILAFAVLIRVIVGSSSDKK